MRLKIKSLDLEAGRPVAFLHQNTAKVMNIHVGERIEISSDGAKALAVVDIVQGIVKENEIAFSNEITDYIKLKSEFVYVSPAFSPQSTQFIFKKLKGKELNKKEIYSIIFDIVNNSLTEAEIAYFVSAVYEKGMSFKETYYLTEAMSNTGRKIKWNSNKIADKHCIGGIPGNRTTPIVVSICAVAGIIMPKTSSRAITSASGTADVIETIAKVDLSLDELKSVVKKTNACLVWGGLLGLAPADDKLIRVERLLNVDPEAQLIASIISKKLSAGSKYILIDIPYGEGAKVSLNEAKKLRDKFIKMGKRFRLKIHVVLTLGDQPIGNGIGPILEMNDILRVLKRDNPPLDLENKSLFLASEILEMMGKAKKGKGLKLASEILESGKAFEKFNEIINAQGRINYNIGFAKHSCDIRASKSGKINKIDNLLINNISRILGCPIDKSSGIYLYYHKKDSIKKGRPLLKLYSESRKKLDEAIHFIKINNPIKIE